MKEVPSQSHDPKTDVILSFATDCFFAWADPKEHCYIIGRLISIVNTYAERLKEFEFFSEPSQMFPNDLPVIDDELDEQIKDAGAVLYHSDTNEIVREYNDRIRDALKYCIRSTIFVRQEREKIWDFHQMEDRTNPRWLSRCSYKGHVYVVEPFALRSVNRSVSDIYFDTPAEMIEFLASPEVSTDPTPE